MPDQPTNQSPIVSKQPLAGTLVEPQQFDPGAFPDLMRRMAGSAKEGTQPKTWRYRRLTMTLEPEVFHLDVFDKAVQLTLQELSTADELDAYRSVGMKSEGRMTGAINTPEQEIDPELAAEMDATSDDGAARGMLMAWVFGRAALYSVNGYVFRDKFEKRFFWDSLSMAGRSFVGQRFLASEAGELDAEIIKKMEASIVVE